jgi:hypothetical protein
MMPANALSQSLRSMKRQVNTSPVNRDNLHLHTLNVYGVVISWDSTVQGGGGGGGGGGGSN